MNVTPLGDRVIITPNERKGSTIIVPETTEPKIGTPTEGTVIAVGPGQHDGGHFVETIVKIGDVVLFGAAAGVKFEIDNQKCRIMREFEIMAVVNPSEPEASGGSHNPRCGCPTCQEGLRPNGHDIHCECDDCMTDDADRAGVFEDKSPDPSQEDTDVDETT